MVEHIQHARVVREESSEFVEAGTSCFAVMMKCLDRLADTKDDLMASIES